MKTADLGAPAGFVNGTPCSSYYNQQMATTLPKFHGRTLPYAVCGYIPSQFRGTYGVTGSGLNGAGQTVAITDAFDSTHAALGRQHVRDPAGRSRRSPGASSPTGASRNRAG